MSAFIALVREKKHDSNTASLARFTLLQNY